MSLSYEELKIKFDELSLEFEEYKSQERRKHELMNKFIILSHTCTVSLPDFTKQSLEEANILYNQIVESNNEYLKKWDKDKGDY